MSKHKRRHARTPEVESDYGLGSPLLDELARLYGGKPQGSDSRNGDVFSTPGSALESGLSLEEQQLNALIKATGRTPALQSQITRFIENLRRHPG